ncbi:MAG: succinylglutamate desuccinylase/aspartoacylase family protein [bacterium]|nr:succinylglutamate desuccinylase/aspartoacylase family protein [bacterium]
MRRECEISIQGSTEMQVPERFICDHTFSADGPLLICVGGLHGNEPAGVEASLRISQAIELGKITGLRGRIISILGNRSALRQKVRFISTDLNRLWIPQKVNKIKDALINGGVKTLEPEEKEQLELYQCLEDILAQEKDRELYFIDLHSTSSHGSPFIICADSPESKSFATMFPIPIVSGLGALVGTLLEHMTSLGATSFVCEGGQHDSNETIIALEQLLLSVMLKLRMINGGEDASAREVLRSLTNGVPRRLHITYRHAITEKDQFRMKPGYRNFTAVKQGEVLATDAQGDVSCPSDGLIFMPLYQARGEDGFFLVTPFDEAN